MIVAGGKANAICKLSGLDFASTVFSVALKALGSAARGALGGVAHVRRSLQLYSEMF
jgi:hypothetical protein